MGSELLLVLPPWMRRAQEVGKKPISLSSSTLSDPLKDKERQNQTEASQAKRTTDQCLMNTDIHDTYDMQKCSQLLAN